MRIIAQDIKNYNFKKMKSNELTIIGAPEAKDYFTISKNKNLKKLKILSNKGDIHKKIISDIILNLEHLEIHGKCTILKLQIGKNLETLIIGEEVRKCKQLLFDPKCYVKIKHESIPLTHKISAVRIETQDYETMITFLFAIGALVYSRYRTIEKISLSIKNELYDEVKKKNLKIDDDRINYYINKGEIKIINNKMYIIRKYKENFYETNIYVHKKRKNHIIITDNLTDMEYEERENEMKEKFKILIK